MTTWPATARRGQFSSVFFSFLVHFYDMRSFWMSASFYSSFVFLCFKLLYMGKKRTFRFFFLCDWFFFTCFLCVFLCFPWLLSISTKYTPIRSVILALHILSSSSSWVSSSSAAGLHKLVNSERTTLFSSKHMRLLGIMWCVCRSVCMYVGKIE